MSLHLIKLCVGCDSVADLEDWIKQKLKEKKRRGQKAERVAEWLLQRNAVHILATDAHDTKRRTPSLSVARDKIAKLYGQDIAKALVDDNPRAVVNDQPLPYFPNPEMEK